LVADVVQEVVVVGKKKKGGDRAAAGGGLAANGRKGRAQDASEEAVGGKVGIPMGNLGSSRVARYRDWNEESW